MFILPDCGQKPYANVKIYKELQLTTWWLITGLISYVLRVFTVCYFQEYFIKASMPALNNWPDCWHTTMLFSLFDFCAVRLAQKDCSQLPLQ